MSSNIISPKSSTYLPNLQAMVCRTLRRIVAFGDWINGLLRVGGRLVLESEPFDSNHQIILPKNDVSNLLVEHYHQICGHSGKEHG